MSRIAHATALRTLAAAGLIATAPLAATALDFTVMQYGKGDLTTAQSEFADLIGPNWLFAVTEDFEGTLKNDAGDTVSAPSQIGPDNTASLTTAVGSFTTLNGKDGRATTAGTGNTAIDTSGGKDDAERGRNLSIRQDGDNQPNGGRQNTSVADYADIDSNDHDTYLDSNDTLGMKWTAGVTDGSGSARAFDRLLFTLTDPADQGKTLTISAGGYTETHEILPRQPNGEIFNVLIAFSDTVTGAEISLEKSGLKDGFSIDNVTVGAVPLPAAAWLLMVASGGLIAAKRRAARAG